MAKVFEVGKTYILHSSCNYDCTATYKVIKRTAKTVTLRGDYPETDGQNKTKNFRIKTSSFGGEEYCNPWGSYSMSPALGADSTVI